MIQDTQASPPALMLFDGVCSLCCGSVQFVARRSAPARLQFLPMQHEQALPHLRHHRLPEREFNTVAVIISGQALTRSDAVLALGRMMRAPWPLLSRLAAHIPKRLRDPLYDWIAHNRFRVFGRREICMMPPEGEHARFLDLNLSD